ncbi:MAG TPA: sulfurtransferase [bacterium]|nr:sulfurtransferase [bacterium]
MAQELVTADWLLEHLNDPNVRVVDCRWVVGEPGEGRRQYEAGHIQGAAHLDIEKHMTGKNGPGRHPLPGRRQFQDALSEIGVTRETRVVAYDSGSGMPAARLWWLLNYYGHENVSILNGGWNGWLAKGGPVSTEVPQFSKTEFVGRPRRKWVTDKEGVDSLRDHADILLIDARAPERYRGEVEPYDTRPGHIPGALNFPFSQALDPSTGLFRKPEELKAEFDKMGAKDAETIICYCGSGITACTDILALKLAGYEAQLYEGSWSDWSADNDLPAAK